METSPPLAPVVEKAKAGDRDAFAALYDATSRALFLYVVGIVGRTDEAEDVLHAAYLAAWERLPSLRRADRFSAWLFRIARNAARDASRRRPRFASLPQDVAARDPHALEEADGPLVSPLDGLLDGVRHETRALLLLLRHGLEWSVDEIATALGSSAVSVRRHLARAHDHLRRRHEGRLAHEH